MPRDRDSPVREATTNGSFFADSPPAHRSAAQGTAAVASSGARAPSSAMKAHRSLSQLDQPVLAGPGSQQRLTAVVARAQARQDHQQRARRRRAQPHPVASPSQRRRRRRTAKSRHSSSRSPTRAALGGQGGTIPAWPAAGGSRQRPQPHLERPRLRGNRQQLLDARRRAQIRIAVHVAGDQLCRSAQALARVSPVSLPFGVSRRSRQHLCSAETGAVQSRHDRARSIPSMLAISW